MKPKYPPIFRIKENFVEINPKFLFYCYQKFGLPIDTNSEIIHKIVSKELKEKGFAMQWVEYQSECYKEGKLIVARIVASQFFEKSGGL